jgi:D-alanyl-D-alanine dipeptidase
MPHLSITKFLLLIIVLVTLISCSSGRVYVDTTKPPAVLLDINNEANDTIFLNLRNYSADFVFDMKYATASNFLNHKVYPCGACFLRAKTLKALLRANQDFIQKGFRIKLFDCYRPLDIQKKMWRMVPNPTFVANPKKGSIHNRGGAVDISIVDANGNEIDMGTTFDFFGPRASHFYFDLPQNVIENRKLLKDIMLQNHFISFDSEWWHYNLEDASSFKLANFKWRGR